MISTILAITGWFAFGLAILIGLLLDMVGLFGNWIILGAVGFAAALTGFDHFGGYTLLILLGLAILGEILEAGAAGAGAAQFGGSKGSMLWAIIGCILGAILFTPLIPIPIVGTIIGACIGSFAGATLYEFLQAKKQLHTAAWVGMGAAMGKVAGMFAKTLIGVIMIAVAAMMY
ncbi:MAG: hypothetical protein COA73_16070 [Candidatus Hydrogenedentota bacterium]|nr:MAG: hypothetical protein COA73_16070 [Candidatus Hydrogenedentota bacterium]